MALYDPNEFPETETVADFTLASFLAWARTKPADEEYNFLQPSHCAVARFGRDCGHPNLIGLTTNEMEALFPGALDAVHPLGGDWTYGGLAKRLESALA